MLMALSSEMKRIAETLDLYEDRLHAIERGQVGTMRVLKLEETLRGILAIVTNDSWNVEAFSRDRNEIARMVSEALDSGTQPLPGHDAKPPAFDFYELGQQGDNHG
jgi:hypothetical protein